MQVNVAFRHMDPSPAVTRYASEKLQHVVNKHVSGMDTDSQVVFSTERFLHVANFTININGMTVKCVEKNEDMYASIDLALEKIERQVKRFKNRIRSHRPDARQRRFTMQVIAPAGAEPLEDEATVAADEIAAASVAPVEATETHVNGAAPAVAVPRSEVYEAPFMSTADAIVQLELRGGAFFVFTHVDSEHLCIVYRRDDGNFGLIQPEAATH